MDVIEFRDYCLSLPHTEESTPFDETTLVYKVGGKMYALADMEQFDCINVKCDPEEAEALRAEYPGDIAPGRHMNKRHWNSLQTAGGLSDSFLRSQILCSYRLVARSLPRAVRETLHTLPE